MKILLFPVILSVCLFSCKKSHDDVEGMEKTKPLDIKESNDFTLKNQVRGQKVFPEDILMQWGYKTAKGSDEFHSIRSQKNYGSSEVKSYARFNLAKAVFSNAELATNEKIRIEKLLKTKEAFKVYMKVLQKGNTLYTVWAISNATHLGHQPKLLKTIEAYLDLK